MPDETLSVVDNRTGRRYEIPIRDGAILATELQKITTDGASSGLMSYDPAFLNTASCRSAITYIDGERGILRYRGDMMWKATELKYEPNPILEHALDVLLILHADHEQNASTNVMRAVGSAHSDPFSATAAAAAALYGPLHGGANEQVLRMLREIGSVSRVPEYVKRVHAGEMRLMGFGHRVYKSHDPRARIIKQVADQVLAVTGRSPMLDIALELERVALADDYFVKHRLYPNVDFYSGIIYAAIGFPVEMFPVLFAIGRTPGWLAQWQEGLLDPEQKIARPRQVYTGAAERHLPGVRQEVASR
jgi:citrate synthase